MFFGYQTSTGDPGAGPRSREWLWFGGSAGACSTLGLRLPFPISVLCLADNDTCWKKSGTARYICHLSRSLSQSFSSANGCSPFLCGFRDKGSCSVSSWLEDVQLLKVRGEYRRPVPRNSPSASRVRTEWTENWQFSLSKYLKVLCLLLLLFCLFESLHL